MTYEHFVDLFEILKEFSVAIAKFSADQYKGQCGLIIVKLCKHA